MIKIAIADDHPIVREGVTSLLSKMGFTVMMEANDGLELIEKLERAKELPDICMIDINMPRMDGFATTEEVMKRWPEIRVLVITVHAESLYFARMIACGARGYLIKDSPAVDYREAILSVQQTGVYFSTAEMRKYMRAVVNKEITPPKLNEWEVKVMRLCCAEYKVPEIAAMLHTTPKAIENHKSSAFAKLGVRTTAGLAIAAVKYGYVLLDSGPSPLM